MLKKEKKRILFGVLSLFWMMIIFLYSARDASVSSQDSGYWIDVVIRFFVPGFHQFSREEQAGLRDLLSLLIRKAAHMTEFGILGVLLYQSRESFCFAGILSVCYAISDEVHQIFVPGRAGRATDVLIDSIGIGIGLLFIFLLKGKKRKEN